MRKDDIKWENNLKQLVCFIKQNKRVPKNTIEDEKQLYSWVRNTVSQYRKGTLADYRTQAILSVMPNFFIDADKPANIVANLLRVDNRLYELVQSNDIVKLNNLGITSIEQIIEFYKKPKQNIDLYKKLVNITSIKYDYSHLICANTSYNKLYNLLNYEVYNRWGGTSEDTLLYYAIFGESTLGVKDEDKDNIRRLRLYRNYILRSLTEKERQIIIKRIYKSRTLMSIAKDYDVVHNRIRQIEAKALINLRHPSRSNIIIYPNMAWRLLPTIVENNADLLNSKIFKSKDRAAIKHIVADLKQSYKLENYTDEFILGLCYFDLFKTMQDKDKDMAQIINMIQQINTMDSKQAKKAYDIFFNQGKIYGDSLIQNEFEDLKHLVLTAINKTFELRKPEIGLSIDEIGLSVRASNILARSELKTIDKLRAASDEELMRLRGMGKGTLNEIREKLEIYNKA